MIVEFIRTWFAPTDVVQVDKIRVRSGQRWRPNEEHDMPDNLYEHLPSSAKIIEPPKDMQEAGKPFEKMTKKKLQEKMKANIYSREMDQVQDAHDEADKTRKEARRKILEKARAAKAAKKAAREAEESAEDTGLTEEKE